MKRIFYMGFVIFIMFVPLCGSMASIGTHCGSGLYREVECYMSYYSFDDSDPIKEIKRYCEYEDDSVKKMIIVTICFLTFIFFLCFPNPGNQQEKTLQDSSKSSNELSDTNQEKSTLLKKKKSMPIYAACLKWSIADGRACRKEFWLWIFFVILIDFGLIFWLTVFDKCVYPHYEMTEVINFLAISFPFIFFIPTFAVFCRRMHDIGRSGWNWLYALVPVLGWGILVYFLCVDSQPDENEYGPNPKESI